MQEYYEWAEATMRNWRGLSHDVDDLYICVYV